MASTTEVNAEDFEVLLEIFSTQPYSAWWSGDTQHHIAKKCEELFKLDYSLIELDNSNGAVSSRYPAKILVPEFEHAPKAPTIVTASPNKSLLSDTLNANGNSNRSKASTTATTLTGNAHSNGHSNGHRNGQSNGNGIDNSTAAVISVAASEDNSVPAAAQPQLFQCQSTIYEEPYDFDKVRDHMTIAKYARCRQRFVVPVILYHGKYICRSATVSVMPETFSRQVFDNVFDYAHGYLVHISSIMRPSDSKATPAPASAPESLNSGDYSDDSTLAKQIAEPTMPYKFSYETVIKSDIELLKALNVTTIVDLMVEKCKIKYFLPVSSSEKADPSNNYADFNLLSMPYPGCEFFAKFRKHNYKGDNLQYDWSKTFNNAPINIPNSGPAADLNIIWEDYEKWDLVLITQNYLKAILKYIQEENASLLIHCISGWDRTPLFISLVRLTLWADGLIHQSLSSYQMTYFTLAYDWYLFGHQLPSRLKRGEDIISFCFYMLKHIAGDEFSLAEPRKRAARISTGSSGSSIVVLNHEEDQTKEDFVLNFEQDSNDSLSNISNCDMPITENFFQTTMTTTKATTMTPHQPMNAAAAIFGGFALTTRSPNPKRSRTSPISVPGTRAPRQRQESTSSNGSWQVVTETGSLENTSVSYMPCPVSPVQARLSLTNRPSPEKEDNSMPTTDDRWSGLPCIEDIDIDDKNGDPTSPNRSNGSKREETTHPKVKPAKIEPSERSKRLNSVRAIFGKTFSKSINLGYIEG